MPADLTALMDHPGWKTITSAQQKQALDLWQDPATTEQDRAQMLQIMQGWATAPAEPSGGQRVVNSLWGMAKEVPELAYNTVVRPFVRAGGYDPSAPPGTVPQTEQEWEARTLGMQNQAEAGAKGAMGLMLGPAAARTGYAAGEALIPRVVPWFGQRAANALPAVGEAAGSYGARQANVAAGNEPAGWFGDVTSVALPLGVRAATSAPTARRLPGSAVAQHEMAAEDMRQGVTRMQPSVAAADLYADVVRQGNPAIPAQQLRYTAQDLIDQELRHGPSLRNPHLLGVAQDLQELATQYGDQIPMDRLYTTMQRVGELVGQAGAESSTATRGLHRLYAGFHAALEQASQSNIPEAATLQQAIRASRQEHAVDRLQRLVGEGRGITEQQGTGYTLVKGKQMRDAFERLVSDDDVFRGSFTPDELAEMRQLFERGVQLPALPPPGSAQRGAGLAALRGSVGGGLGYVLGGPEGAAMGTAAGIAAPEVLARVMLSPRGRQYLRAALAGQEALTPQTLAVFNEVVRSQLPGEPYTSKRTGTSAP